MDLFESLDDAAAEANDPVLSAAVAEVNACYDQLARRSGDSGIVFERLNKAAAVVRGKLAERDAKRLAATGLDDAAIKKMKDRNVDGQVADLKEKLNAMASLASEGDANAQRLVEAQSEVEAANGGKTVEEIYRSLFK